jgi:hypothetical protein
MIVSLVLLWTFAKCWRQHPQNIPLVSPWIGSFMQFGEFSDDDSSKIISIGDDWNLKKSIFLWLLLRYGTSKLDKDATFCSSSFLSVEMYLRSTHETKRVDARTHSLTGECWHSSTKIAACTPVKELIPRESRINSSLGCMRQSFWLCQKRGLMKDLFL